jgi:phospholipase C
VDRGYLPAVCWVYAPDGKSEHPPWKPGAGPVVGPGMQWTADRVTKVARSAVWGSTVIFITWDDWGGWYDHVDPPKDAVWPGGGPQGYAGSQFRYGPRVPCLVVSPYAKSGHISKVHHSHVSVVKFCCTQFGVPTWNDRLKTADDMSDCFDFTRSPAPPPTASGRGSVVAAGPPGPAGPSGLTRPRGASGGASTGTPRRRGRRSGGARSKRPRSSKSARRTRSGRKGRK